MANQITHIALNERVFQTLFSQFKEQDFYMGSVFPDIRYLGTITRDQTHFRDPTLQEILNLEDSFEAGMRYHSLVDETRERFMIQAGIYDLMPASKYRPHALKCLEDELYYPEVHRWPAIRTFFDTTLPQETTLVAPEIVQKWHQTLQSYFTSLPSEASRHDFVMRLGGSEEMASEIAMLVEAAKSNQTIIDHIRRMHTLWPTLLT